MNEKSWNMRRWFTTKEFQLRGQLLITMQLKLRCSTFPKKLKKQSLSMSLLKELGKESSISQLKHKLSTILKGKNMLPDKVGNTFKLDTSTKTKPIIKLQLSLLNSTSLAL